MPQDQQPKTELTLDEFREQARERYGIPKGLWESVRGQESGGDANAVSPTGVRGELQVTRDTARAYGLNRDDPFHQIAAGAKNLREGYDRYKNQFSDDNERWLAATSYYYYGPGGVKPDGTLSTDSKDGVSNPAEHVSRVARRWKAYNDSQTTAPTSAPQQPTQAPIATPANKPTALPKPKPTYPNMGTGELVPPSPRQVKEREQIEAEDRRRNVLKGQIRAFEDLKQQGNLNAANQIAADIKNRWGDIMEVGTGEGGWPYLKPKTGTGFVAPPLPSSAPSAPQTADDYNKQSWLERRRRNVATGYEMGAQGLSDTLARGVDVVGGALEGDFRPLKEQAEGSGRGLLKLASAFDPVNAEETYKATAAEQDPALAALDRRRAERLKNDPYTTASNAANQRLAAESAAQPGFGGAVTRGVVSGGMQALPYIATGVAGGGIPALAGVAAAQSDFVRPEEAALNIAGATLPIPVGRALTPLVNRVAGALPGRILPAVTRAAGQVGVGAGTNVATMAAAGERDPRRLAEGAVVGGVLSGVDALKAARAGAPASGVDRAVIEAAANTPGRAPVTVTRGERQATFGGPSELPATGAQTAADIGVRQAIDRYTQAVDQINRSQADPGTKAAKLAQARATYQSERQAATQAAQAPNIEAQAQNIAPVAAATPAVELPLGVRIIRQGEQIPPREKGQRQIPIEVDRGDGTMETVLVLAPDRIDGRRVNETTLRPMVESAIRNPQSASPNSSAAQPDVTIPEAVSSQPPPAQPTAPRRQPAPIPFIQLGPEGLRGRTPGGAIAGRPSPLEGRRLLPPARGEEILPTEPLSRAVEERIAQPDPRFVPRPPEPNAPATQRIPTPVVPDAQPTREMPRPPIPDVNQRLIERTRARADELIAKGQFDEAVAALKAHQQALRDAKAQAKSAPGLRVQLEQQIGQAGNRIGEVRQMARDAAKRAAQENAPTAELPPGRARAQQPATRQTAETPLLGEVNNPEGGVPPRTESLSGRFGALVRQQAAQMEAAPQSRRKATETLSPVEYLKRQTKGEGIRVSDRGEAALLGAKEAGIVGLTNRNSKWRLSDAQVMLDEGGFMLEDGRRFTDPSVTETDVLEFLGASGKEGRLGTRGVDQRLADEEAEYYARLEAEEGQRDRETGKQGEPLPTPHSPLPAPPVAPRRTPPAPSAPRRPGQRVGTPQPRRISETGALEDVGDFFDQMKAEEVPTEAPGPPRPRTERLPVPEATPENIKALRDRREELSRLAYNRRGEMPVDLGDEMRELGAKIIGFENEQAKAARGGRPELGPPPGLRPERMTPPPEEKAARRAALQPKAPEQPRTVTHPNPAINGKQVIAETQDGRVLVPNPENKSGVSVVKDRASTGAIPAEAMEDLNIPGAPPSPLAKMGKEAPVRGRQSYAIPEKAAPDLARRTKPKFVLDAEQRLREATAGKIAGSGGQQLVDAAVVTGWKVYKAGMDFARWSAEVVKQAGEKVRPHLRAAWDQINKSFSVGALPGETKGGTYLGSGFGGLQRGVKGKGVPKASPSGDDLTFRERVGRKIGTAQTMAQLLNPKTVGQNLIGNAAFSGAKNAATFAALPIDKFLSVFSKQRQVATPEMRTQVKDFVGGFTDVYHAVRSGDYKSLADNRYELNNERVFKNKVGGFFEDVMRIGLEGPDRGAFLAAYNDSVQQILAAHGKSKTKFSLDKIHEQAKMEAQQAVFKDSNMISEFAVGLRNVLNKITPFGKKANFGLGDLVGLKYAKTPANLVARGIEYSPVNFINAFYKIGKVMAGKGKGFDQREAALAFGKAFVGSAFGSGLGAALYSMGIITQPEQENRGVQAAERGEGLNGYQINLSALRRYAGGGLLSALTGDLGAGKKQAGDVLMSYDWLQPWAFSLGMGAAAAKAFKNRKADADALDDTLTQIDAVTSTLTDQSILRNIRDIGKYGVKSTARKVVTDAPASFVPSVLNLARQAIDDRAREISHEKGASGIKREALDKVLNKLPGASKRLPERKDIVGRSIPSRLEGADGAALVPIPGRFNRYNPHPVLTEMQEVGSGTTGISRKPDETEGQFRARRALAAEWTNKYGLGLTTSKVYQSASKEERKAAVDYLKEQISKQSGVRRPSLYLFAPGHVLEAAREAERNKKRKAAQAGAALQ